MNGGVIGAAFGLTSIAVPKEGRALDQIHRFIMRLLTDEEFRQLALSDTATALSQFQFSATEQSSLNRLCMRLRADEDPMMQQFSLARYWTPW